MRRAVISLAIMAATVAAMAQTLNVEVGNVTYAFPAKQAGEMNYSGASSLTILNREFAIGEISRMYVDATEVKDNSVAVTYDGATAKVAVAGNIAQYVTPTVSGAYVSIDQSSEVGDDTCGEITYTLTGSSSDGQFQLNGSYKATVELQGLDLSCSTGAPLDIQDSKRVEMSVKKNTANSLTDCSGGSQKGCISCKGHLELKGNGSLTIDANTGHGIYAKEYIEMKNCSIEILNAVKDGVNCNQYFLMESGTLVISNVGDDAVQVSFKDDTDREEEDTGCITIAGGTLTASTGATAAKCLKADADVTISGGSITLSTAGGGKWDSDDVKTKAASCISADGNITIDGGAILLTSTGSGGKGMSCDGDFVMNDGEVVISTSGGVFIYLNGVEYPDYTGSTDRIDSDYKSSAKGVKADGNVTINGGSISVKTTGNGSEGIESKAVLTINGGTVSIHSRDDGLNSSSHMYINGGDVTVVATANDGLDSNGNLYITGGTVRAFGASSPECGIDANSEQGYSVIFTGGSLLAVGGGNSVPSSSSSQSTQPYVSASLAATAGSTVVISSNGTALASFTVPSNYGTSSNSPAFAGRPGGPGGGGPGGGGMGGSMVITCPGLTSGQQYTVTSGSNSTTVTAR
ncbi:MAG: carbohydrate-binding domain-containing protein [Muribaculaceae bacterium]